MKKKVLLGIFLSGIILFVLVIKTSSITALLSSDNQQNLALSSTSLKLSDLSLTPHEPIVIINDGNFTDYGFPGLGTAEEPYIIENFNITTINKEGIYINETTKHFVVRNCYVDADFIGIQISYVAKGTASIINNTCSTNWYGTFIDRSSGIYLSHSYGMTLTNYTCKHNDFGICLHRSSGGLYPSPSSLATVTDNICSKNRIGIYLESSSLATVTDNTCKNNGDGIYLVSSSHVMVTDNICGNNTYSGIFLGSSSHAMLTDNACNNNKFYGIKLRSDSDYCIIHHNIFRDNNLEGTSQACDGGKNNTWYEEETQEGNCWSDWKSKKPYPIDGDANATDPYPLNKNLERIDYEYTLIIPALILLTILPRIKRKEKSKIYY